MVADYLGMPATSMPSERVNSVVGRKAAVVIVCIYPDDVFVFLD
jgi:hypothetical protein